MAIAEPTFIGMADANVDQDAGVPLPLPFASLTCRASSVVHYLLSSVPGATRNREWSVHSWRSGTGTDEACQPCPESRSGLPVVRLNP